MLTKIALDLNVFEKLKGLSFSLKSFSKLLGIPPSSARVLAQSLCTLKLLKYKNGRLYNSPLSQKYLTIDFHEFNWMAHLFQVNEWSKGLKNKILHPKTPEWHAMMEGRQKVRKEFYTGWFHQRRVQWGLELTRQYNFTRHKVILDIGGGCGGWLIGILKKFPDLQGRVFDLPEVKPWADRQIQQATLSHKIKFVSGSFLRDPLPKGADVALLANVLHDWSPSQDSKILTKVYNVLPVGGVVLIWEFFFHDDFSGPPWAFVQALSVLGPKNKSGWQPTRNEMLEILSKTKFRNIKFKKNLIIAIK
ncbi:MAG: methyltransferase [Candidatus Omnitrophota bacterium]